MIAFEPSSASARHATPTVAVEYLPPCALPFCAVEPLDNTHRAMIRKRRGKVKTNR